MPITVVFAVELLLAEFVSAVSLVTVAVFVIVLPFVGVLVYLITFLRRRLRRRRPSSEEGEAP